MYLLLFTVIYCLVSRITITDYLEPETALGIYLIAIAILKGSFSKGIKDVFNLKKTQFLFKKIKFKDTSMELLCLILVYINSYFMNNEPVSLFEFVYLLVGFVIVYRFLFWGITWTIRER